MKTKFDIYKSAFDLFLNHSIPEKILNDYLTQDYFEAEDVFDIQDFISCNLKKEIIWSTAIGIMDAVEVMYEEAVANGNIKDE